MDASYIESMQAHVDEGGKLSHQNAIDLLAEVKRLNAMIDVIAPMESAAIERFKRSFADIQLKST